MASARSSTGIGVGGPHPSGWPLIGRDDVLNQVAVAIARLRFGSLVLSGRRGAGRSRLAHEALRSARSGGLATEWFVASPAAVEGQESGCTG